MDKEQLPYNLTHKYAYDDWTKDIVLQRVVHPIPNIWKDLSKYGIKYTETKNGKFFPTNINIIGIGSFSIVYEIVGTKYILKISNHNSEVEWSEMIQSLQLNNNLYNENYVKIYDILNSSIFSNLIASDYEDQFECSFIIIEKMQEIEKSLLDKLIEFDNKLWDGVGCRLNDEYLEYWLVEGFVNDIQISDKPLDTEVYKVVQKFIQLGRDIENFDWKDHHWGNLMKDMNGNYKFIDLQISE